MKKSITMAVTSLALLLAGGTVTAAASANTAQAYEITATPQEKPTNVTRNGQFQSIILQRVGRMRTIRVTDTSAVGMLGFDAKTMNDGLISNTYGQGTTLRAVLYYDPLTGTEKYLINDPATSMPSWVKTTAVKVIEY